MSPSGLPNFEKGIDYWTNVDATVDGVLGGFGTGVRVHGPAFEDLKLRF
jgi:hypothetical protein